MAKFNLENCKYNFSSDTINIFVLLYDISTSMEYDVGAMRKANKAFYDDFSKFEERGSIAIAKGVFSQYFDMSCFSEVKNFNTGYNVEGATALYYAITCAANNTIEYYDEIVKRLNVRPRITFLVFTDGENNRAGEYYGNAVEAIKELNSLDATTVLVAFREAINSGIGEDLGFSCVKNINTVKELINCMGSELSKSCKEQSKSAYSLKSAFFSQADGNAEEDVAQNQAFMEDDFFNIDI